MNLEKYTVLYVEDEPEIQKNIAEYLGHYFKTVYLAAKASEGLKQFIRYRPDVLLLDVNLPDSDGLTLAKKIRGYDNDIPIIMLSAFGDQKKLLTAIDLKIFKYLLKPVDLYLFDETLQLLEEELLLKNRYICDLDDSYHWNISEQRLMHNHREVPMTSKERLLLGLLLQHRGHAVDFEEIMAIVWAEQFEREISHNCVKNIVTSLRKKLPPQCIRSVYAKGYIIY